MSASASLNRASFSKRAARRATADSSCAWKRRYSSTEMIATFVDRSNDTGFAVIAEDQTNDTGFLVGTPINDACDDTPSVSPDDPEGPRMLVTADDETRDRIISP